VADRYQQKASSKSFFILFFYFFDSTDFGVISPIKFLI